MAMSRAAELPEAFGERGLPAVHDLIHCLDISRLD
jgi:hypothetical protein